MNEEFVNRKLDLLARASASKAQTSISSEDTFTDVNESAFNESQLTDDSQVLDADSSGDQQDSDSQIVEETLANDVSHDEEESEEIDSDESIVQRPPRRSTVTARPKAVVPEDESMDDSVVDHGIDTSHDEALNSEHADLSQSQEDSISSEESDGQQDDDTSDESFDVTEESIESSFEAPPKARTSRARQSTARSKTTVSTPTIKPAATRRRTTAAKASTANGSRGRGGAKSAPATSRSSTRMPLRDSQAGNQSQDASISEHNSDASLLLTKSSTKTPKKRYVTIDSHSFLLIVHEDC